MWEILLVTPTVPGQVKVIVRSGDRVQHVDRIEEGREAEFDYEAHWRHGLMLFRAGLK